MIQALALLVGGFGSCAGMAAESKITPISSLAELAEAAARDGQTVRMKAGVYKVSDFIPPSAISGRRQRGEWSFLKFSGSGNVFHLDGVTIELDTALRGALHAPIHTDEFLVQGNNNTLTGLTITNLGDGKALGGAVLGVVGRGNTLQDCTVHVQGSAPYGYGDLFGKGGFKHSGVHITGSGTRLLGCKVFTKAFGHAFYLQEDCADCIIENCHAEGVMRPTGEILAETAGLAFKRHFRTEMTNRSGAARILPGYVKALSEDGFRTYGQHKNLVIKNCTARNMRGGFELRTRTAPRLENCTATGCERAFWVSDGAVVSGCQGDCQFGPLLYVEGDGANVQLELLPTPATEVLVHAAAAIYGTGNVVRITLQDLAAEVRLPPVMLGYCPPGMGENMAPFAERKASGCYLENRAALPVIIGSKASGSLLVTNGPVQENQGKNITVVPLRDR